MSNTSRTDWEALSRMQDSEIDYSDLPVLDEKFFDRAVVRIPAAQAQSLIQLEPDVLAWFQSQGPDYKSLINSVLRSHMSGN